MLLNINDLSKELKIHNNTIYIWIKQGMPCFKKGRVIRFNLDKVMEWLEKNEVEDEVTLSKAGEKKMERALKDVEEGRIEKV